MRKILPSACLFALVWTRVASCDFAWIPNYKTLFLRLGGDFLSSSENFGSAGAREDILYNQGPFTGIPLKFKEMRFWVEPEYGFAKDMSFALRADLVLSDIGPLAGGEPSFGSSALGDVRASVKWRFRRQAPVLTGEFFIGIPTYRPEQTNLQVDDLLPGDGAFDFGLILHTGVRWDEIFLALSPGFVFRSNTYDPQLRIAAAFGGRYEFLYGFVFGNVIYGLGNGLLFDSSPISHDALGSGGTYARLTGSPRGMNAGLKIGANIYRKYSVELSFTKALFGNRYPNYFQFGFGLLMVHSFFEKDKRVPIKEIPFDEKHEFPDPLESESGANGNDDVSDEELPGDPEDEPTREEITDQ